MHHLSQAQLGIVMVTLLSIRCLRPAPMNHTASATVIGPPDAGCFLNLCIRFLCSLLLFGATSQGASAQIEVVVDQEFHAIHYVQRHELAPGEVVSVQLPLTATGDRFVAMTTFRGQGLRIKVLDGSDVKTLNPKAVLLLNAALAFGVPASIGQPPSTDGLVAVISNQSTSLIVANIRIDRVGTRSRQIRSEIRDWIAIPLDALAAVYRLPKLTVTVRPCGEMNAFSSPNIVICSELIADLGEKKALNALYPILLHELAHSLLFVWNLPGYDNEDMADEFAAMFLATLSPEFLADYIRWLETHDSATEAIVQMIVGSRHSISIQRARNMRRIASSPDQTIARWAKLLAPYARH